VLYIFIFWHFLKTHLACSKINQFLYYVHCRWNLYTYIDEININIYLYIYFFLTRNKLPTPSTCHFDETPYIYTHSLFYASLNINKFRRMTFPFQQINWVPTSLSLRAYRTTLHYYYYMYMCVYKMMKNNNRLAHVFWMKGVTVDNHVIYVRV